MKLMQDLLAESFLLEANGVEVQTIHNLSGVPKKFRKVDGDWEHPAEAKAWMKARGNPKADREEVAARKKAERENKPVREVKPKLDYQKIYNKVIDVIGQTFPDGDPIDSLAPYIRRMGVKDWDVMDVINAAMKKCGNAAEKKGLYPYMAILWKDCSSDALYDAKTMQKKGKESDSPFITYDDKGNPKARNNPWK